MRRDDMKIYVVWKNMKQRCNKPRKEKGEAHYEYISYCEDWERFEPFFEWAMNNGYVEGLRLDRINNEGNYCPENCRFITNKENSNNRSNNRFITFEGKTLTISQWAERVEMPVQTLLSRLKKWSVEKSLTAPKWTGVDQTSKQLKRDNNGRFLKNEY
jgi:hypothetical protein